MDFGETSPVQFMDLRRNESFAPLICYAPTMTSMHGFWLGNKPLDYSVPLFLLQLMLIIGITRAIDLLFLRRLGQPRYISEVIGGFLLGPSGMGKINNFAFTLFPLRSVVVLEAMSQVGLIYFMFTVGVEIEPTVVRHTGVQSLALAAVGLLVPFTIGSLAGLSLCHKTDEQSDLGAFIVFLGLIFSMTALSVLARILAELKLLSSDVGRLIISSAIVVNSCCWILFVLALTLQLSGGDMLASLWTVLSGLVFVVVTFAAVKPAVWWVMRRTPEGEDVEELHACVLLAGVMAWSFIADAIGTHAVVGAFTYGLAVPTGPVGEALIEKVEDVIEGLLLPLFFIISGLRMNIEAITNSSAAVALVMAVLGAALAKMVASALVGVLYQMSLNDGLAHGILSNTKGVIELAMLNIGRDKNVIGDQTFTILVITSVLLTFLVKPALKVVAQTSRRFVLHKRRAIQWSRPESELRLMVCIHTTKHVPAMISLLEISNPMKRSPIFVYALHLVELTGRATSMLVFTTKADSSAHGHTNLGRIQTQSEHIMTAFESYEQHAGGVSIQPLTAFSPYATMHEDICGLAEEKRATMIVLPFHKQKTVGGDMEVTHPALRSLNQHVLAGAPCSVAILVDRGLASTNTRVGRRVALFFFGGADDREALAYGTRIASNPSVALTVVRFMEKPRVPSVQLMEDERVVTVAGEDYREEEMDEEQLKEFRRRSAGIETVEYGETASGDAEETMAAIREMAEGFDMYVVGRRQRKGSAMTAGLTEFSECPELGPIGDYLASPDFGSNVSVLVVQQTSEEVSAAQPPGPVAIEPDSPGKQVRLYMSNDECRGKGATTRLM